MRVELVDWAQCTALARRLAALVRDADFTPDVIVAIGRGGWVPARLLSDRLDIYRLAGFKVEHYRAAHRQAQARVRIPLCTELSGERVLLVDDVSDAGDTFEVAVAHVREHGPPAELRTAVLHHKRVSSFVPDFFAAEIREWRWLTYPWAVHEDVSGFIRELDMADAATGALMAAIEQNYGIRVPAEILEDARRLAQAGAA